MMARNFSNVPFYGSGKKQQFVLHLQLLGNLVIVSNKKVRFFKFKSQICLKITKMLKDG